MLTVPTVRRHELPASLSSLRGEVRSFLAQERDAGTFEPHPNAWMAGHSPAFSEKLGARGWIGMTWPARYGGHERTELERFVVTEELLAAGAPVAAHWGADRQIGPMLLRYGSEEQRQSFLPRFARGECPMSAGMSEPDSGSDLASLRSRARQVPEGWRLDGRKIWVSHAHRAEFVVVLCRTDEPGGKRHEGLSQLIVATDSAGVEIRPIKLMTGEAHFNEITFDDVFVPDAMVLGEPGHGWAQISSELAYERAGPDRYLSTYPLLAAYVSAAGAPRSPHVKDVLGELIASMWTLRALSLGVAEVLSRGDDPGVIAALVKDLGTVFEQRLVDAVHELVDDEQLVDEDLRQLLDESLLTAPMVTLRGGTTEVLRMVIARALGVR